MVAAFPDPELTPPQRFLEVPVEWRHRAHEFLYCDFASYPTKIIDELWEWDAPDKAQSLAARLTQEQICLWAILNADGQVCNGGFSQFFYNSYGELAEEALSGFKLFGMNEYADIFDAAYAVFSGRPIPKNRAQRIAMLNDMIDDEADEPITEGPDVPIMLQQYGAIATSTAAHWEALESQYYELSRRKGIGRGYHGAFYKPLTDFIQTHPERFFHL